MQKRFLPAALLLGICLLVCAVCGGIRMRESAPAFALAQGQKEVYLTFDDGPSTAVTNRILDILKEEDVKATFFVVSDRALSRKETLRRIAQEGHAIGVHSACHEYGKIYASRTAFLADVEECERIVEEIANVKPRLYRFPGGGPAAAKKEDWSAVLRERGYRIVGWNAVCGDEELPGADADALVRETIATSEGKNSVVLLLHDSAHHRATAEALPSIIGYYRAQGYIFRLF